MNRLDELEFELKDAIKRAMNAEYSYQVTPAEQQLLWLILSTLPAEEEIDNPQPQPYFGGGNSRDPASMRLLPAAVRVPQLNDSYAALERLAKFAKNREVRRGAAQLLADMTLASAERAAMLATKDPTGLELDFVDAIELYRGLLPEAVTAEERANIYYQLARAYDLSGQQEEALATLEQLTLEAPAAANMAEVWFRVGEMHFGMGDYPRAEKAYRQLATQLQGSGSHFVEKGIYKLGWSLFKLGDYQGALQQFFDLVDRHWPQREQGSDAERRLLGDALRVISMTFANMEGLQSLHAWFKSQQLSIGGPNGPTVAQEPPYKEYVYQDMGHYFERKRRYTDAAETFSALTTLWPNSPKAPYYQSRVVTAYIDGGFPSRSWPERERFVALYGSGSPYWQQHDATVQQEIRGYMNTFLLALAQRDHALAQRSQRRDHYRTAVGWYTEYVNANPDAEQSANVYFLRGEAQTEMGDADGAIQSYLKAGFEFPNYPKAAIAAYAALVTYQRLVEQNPGESGQRWLAAGIDHSRLFVERFPDDPQTPLVQTKLAEDLLIQGESQQALELARSVLDRIDRLDSAGQLRLWRVVAHASFALEHYSVAEDAYLSALSLQPTPKEAGVLRSRYADSIYKQGEMARNKGALVAALAAFQRLSLQLPDALIRPQADFDAAVVLLELQRWNEAAVALETFRTRFPKHPLQLTTLEKLVLAYEQAHEWERAAGYLTMIYQREGLSELGRDALWRTAELYAKAELHQQARQGFERYIAVFPQPVEPTIEAMHRIAALELGVAAWGDYEQALRRIIDSHDQAAAQGSARTLFLASESSLQLGRRARARFDAEALLLPLAESLARKQQAMVAAIGHFTKTIQYGIAEHATESTAAMGAIYYAMARGLMESERPVELNDLELEQYGLLLEDQAFPFEDKAIELYEFNMSQIGNDIYDEWIVNSLEALKLLMPSRYVKPERVESYVDQIN